MPRAPARVMAAIAAAAFAALRAAMMTRAPAPASCSAVKYPTPALPPVTTNVLPACEGRSVR